MEFDMSNGKHKLFPLLVEAKNTEESNYSQKESASS